MDSKPEIIALVPAAGRGTRMNSQMPKQYLKLQGKTILEHSLSVLLSYPAVDKIIVAISQDDCYANQLSILQNPKIKRVDGGLERSESVLNCLSFIEPEHRRYAWVLVHDAARPCLMHQDLDRLLAVNDQNGAILAMPAVDTIKRADSQHQIIQTENRNQLWMAQTPQFFSAQLLYEALINAKNAGLTVTDEASAMELLGFKPHLIKGSAQNIKVTHAEDLALAEFYLSQLAQSERRNEQ